MEVVIRQLFAFVKKGRLDRVREFLSDEDYAHLRNAVDERMEPLVYVAAKHGHLPIVHYLCQIGVEARDVCVCHKLISNWSTPILYKYGMVQAAILSGNRELVLFLLDTLDLCPGKEARFTETPLHLAAKLGHVDIVDELLARGVDIEQGQVPFCKTALWSACERGHAEVVERLLSAGALVNTVDKNDVSALAIASKRGHKDVVDLLLAHRSIAVNIHSVTGSTALHEASANGHLDVVVALLEKGADPLWFDNNMEDAASLACANGHVEVLGEFVKRGVLGQLAEVLDVPSMLMIAVQHGQREVVRAILKRGWCEVDLEAFHEACASKDMWMVRRLLDAGASVTDVDDEHEQGPLHVLLTPHPKRAPMDEVAILRLLVERGADPERANRFGLTPVGMACMYGKVACLETFFQLGRVRKLTALSKPFWAACGWGHAAVVRILLERVPRSLRDAILLFPGLEGLRQRNPLENAAMWGHDDVVRLLLDAMEDGWRKTWAIQDAFRSACRFRHQAVVRRLLEAGAKVHEGEFAWSRTAIEHIFWDSHVRQRYILDVVREVFPLIRNVSPWSKELRNAITFARQIDDRGLLQILCRWARDPLRVIGTFIIFETEHPEKLDNTLEIIAWCSDGHIPKVIPLFVHNDHRLTAHSRQVAIQHRRLRDLLQPLVNNRDLRRVRHRYTGSPLLKVPMLTMFHILEYVFVVPIRFEILETMQPFG